MPGSHEAYILGHFYAKQIDVGLSSWQRGPDLLVSTKTMFSAYRKNLKNRHEEAVGEVSSLRRRHPMAAMGYAYLVRRNIYDEEGAYAILYDILTRLRRTGETFDATMLLVAAWDDSAREPIVASIDEPASDLSASLFFTNLIDAVTARAPVTEHQTVRLRRDGEPVGGLPEDDALDVPDDPSNI
jgi:CRISPR/Cas system CSM-associated protein Csm2 small subunit